MSIYARVAIVALIVGSIAGAWWKFDRMLAAADRSGYTRRAYEDEAAADLQRETNRAKSHLAETTYAVKAEARDKFFDATAKGIHDASLTACVVPEPVRVRLNAAASCARDDRPAACDGNAQVPDAR